MDEAQERDHEDEEDHCGHHGPPTIDAATEREARLVRKVPVPEGEVLRPEEVCPENGQCQQERARIDAAFREMLGLLRLASRGAPNESTRRAARKKHRTTAAAGLEQTAKKAIVDGPARAKKRRY